MERRQCYPCPHTGEWCWLLGKMSSDDRNAEKQDVPPTIIPPERSIFANKCISVPVEKPLSWMKETPHKLLMNKQL